ncbi:MAG: M28 family metallopeptidase [Myxococcales bacterium]
MTTPRSFTTSAALLLSLAALAPARAAPPAAAGRAPPAKIEKAATARVTAAEISGHLRFLSDDLLEGRKPGTRGSNLAVAYIAAQLEAFGLAPGAPAEGSAKASYVQPVPLVRMQGKVPGNVEFRAAGTAGAAPLSLTTGGGVKADLVIAPDAHVDLAKVDDAELVFAGYGIVAPEYGWDDYKDVDVRGKIVVLLNFNPPFAGEPDGKRVRLWYGRWDYKYQTAAAHGAAGVYIIHTTESAGYPWQVLSNSAEGVRFALPPQGEPRLQFQGWVTDGAAHKLFALGGKDLDVLRGQATGPDGKAFRPVSLGVRSSLSMPIERRTIESANVIGVIPGTDPALRGEAVVFTAHHDHLGSVPSADGKDGIYNGALDNASGVAAILTMAHAATLSPSRRSLYFCFVTAEEQGLLGSRWLAQHPPVPAGRIAADINIDSFNKFGLTRDVGLLGLGKSSLDAVVRKAAAEQGRVVHGDPFPDRGAFYRSDMFELARVGVPPVALKGGPSYVDRPEGWGQAQQEAYERKDYHQPSDEYHGDWDLRGAVQDAQLDLVIGLRVGNAPALPRWTPGDEFEGARKAAAR